MQFKKTAGNTICGDEFFHADFAPAMSNG